MLSTFLNVQPYQSAVIGKCFMANAISVRDIINQVSKRCTSETPIPSESWVRFNFSPRNPHAKVARHYRGRLKVKHAVQKRLFRKTKWVNLVIQLLQLNGDARLKVHGTVGSIKDAVFQSSSPLHYATELHSFLLPRIGYKTILFMGVQTTD